MSRQIFFTVAVHGVPCTISEYEVPSLSSVLSNSPEPLIVTLFPSCSSNSAPSFPKLTLLTFFAFLVLNFFLVFFGFLYSFPFLPQVTSPFADL